MNTVAFSNDVTVADFGVFVMGFLPSQEVDTVVRYAVGRGVNRIAVLAPDNDYGARAVEALNYAAADLGAEVSHVALYDPGGEDPAPVVKELAERYTRDRAYNGLLLAEGGRRLTSVAALLPYYYVNTDRVRVLGMGRWDVPGIGAKRKKALLHHFGSARAVARAGLTDLEAVEGISRVVAQKIYDHFHTEN